MNDVGQILLGWVGIVIWFIGAFVAMLLSVEEKSIGNRIATVIMCFLIFGALGMAFACTSIFSPVRNYTYTYEVPTSIVKTNDVVMANHIINGRIVASAISYDTKGWNATNIMTAVKSGKNFFGKETNPNYNIVIH